MRVDQTAQITCPQRPRIDAVTDRNDHVQAIVGDRFIRTGNVHFLHIAFLTQLA